MKFRLEGMYFGIQPWCLNQQRGFYLEKTLAFPKVPDGLEGGGPNAKIFF